MFELKKPKILGSDKGNVEELRRFLYTHTEEVQFVINSLETRIVELEKKIKTMEDKKDE